MDVPAIPPYDGFSRKAVEAAKYQEINNTEMSLWRGSLRCPLSFWRESLPRRFQQFSLFVNHHLDFHFLDFVSVSHYEAFYQFYAFLQELGDRQNTR